MRSAGGFNPGRVLPCVIDVGTNNELLRQEPWWVLRMVLLLRELLSDTVPVILLLACGAAA